MYRNLWQLCYPAGMQEEWDYLRSHACMLGVDFVNLQEMLQHAVVLRIKLLIRTVTRRMRSVKQAVLITTGVHISTSSFLVAHVGQSSDIDGRTSYLHLSNKLPSSLHCSVGKIRVCILKNKIKYGTRDFHEIEGKSKYGGHFLDLLGPMWRTLQLQ